MKETDYLWTNKNNKYYVLTQSGEMGFFTFHIEVSKYDSNYNFKDDNKRISYSTYKSFEKFLGKKYGTTNDSNLWEDSIYLPPDDGKLDIYEFQKKTRENLIPKEDIFNLLNIIKRGANVSIENIDYENIEIGDYFDFDYIINYLIENSKKEIIPAECLNVLEQYLYLMPVCDIHGNKYLANLYSQYRIKIYFLLDSDFHLYLETESVNIQKREFSFIINDIKFFKLKSNSILDNTNELYFKSLNRYYIFYIDDRYAKYKENFCYIGKIIILDTKTSQYNFYQVIDEILDSSLFYNEVSYSEIKAFLSENNVQKLIFNNKLTIENILNEMEINNEYK